MGEVSAGTYITADGTLGPGTLSFYVGTYWVGGLYPTGYGYTSSGLYLIQAGNGGNLGITGNLNVSAGLTVGQYVQLNDGLTVYNGSTLIQSATTVNSTLNVTGQSTFNGFTATTGAFSSSLAVTGIIYATTLQNTSGSGTTAQLSTGSTNISFAWFGPGLGLYINGSYVGSIRYQ